MINILYLHAGAEMYGADKVMLDLIKRLDREKFTPYVILPTDGVLVDALRQAGAEVTVMPYPIMRRRYFNPVGIIRYAFGMIKYTGKIAAWAKQHGIHVIHNNTAATLEGAFVSRRLHIPLLWEIHEIIVSPRIMHKVTSWLVARYADTAVTVSQAVKEHLTAGSHFRRDTVKVIYNGVDADRFSPEADCDYLYDEWNIPRDAQVIGMVGRVNSWKGQGDLLKAAESVMATRPNVYTVFAGAAFEGEEWREQELADAIAASPYHDRIIQQGYRTDSRNIYKLLDVFVLPSTNPDPLPTVVLEAMATGKPVVGYRHGGVCEMVEEGYNGLLADVRDTADLAEKIARLLDDSALRAAMGEHSRQRLLERFSIDAYIKNFEAEYTRLTEK